MPGTAAIQDVEDVLVQFCFFTPLVFLIVYTMRTPWWKTLAGRVLAALAFVFVFVLLRAELIIWGVLSPRNAQQADALAWASVAVLGLAPLAFGALTWFLLRDPLRLWWHWMRAQEAANPLTTGSGAGSLSDFELRSRQTKSSPGDDGEPDHR